MIVFLSFKAEHIFTMLTFFNMLFADVLSGAIVLHNRQTCKTSNNNKQITTNNNKR